jgi:hypothetical protein
MPYFQQNPLIGIRQQIQSAPRSTQLGQARKQAPPWAANAQQPTPATLPAQAPGTAPAGTGGVPQVQTSINPAPLYTPAMTNQAANRAFDENLVDMRTAMKLGDRPGVSRSAGSISSALPIVGQGLQAGMQARAAIPLQDEIANQQHLFGGEVAREQQGLDLASLLARQQQIQNQANLGLQGQNISLVNLLAGLMQ